jgi:hypothetical protein
MSVLVSSPSSPCSFPSSASIIFNSSNSNLTTSESLSQIQRRAALYPLHDAASWDHFHNLKLLLQNGADVNQQENKEGNTPLHFAAKAGLRSERCLRLLLAFGADPTRKNSNGETPSALMTDARLLQFLLQKEEEHALRKEGQLRIYDPNLACARWRLTKCMLRGGFLYCYSANQKVGDDGKEERTGERRKRKEGRKTNTNSSHFPPSFLFSSSFFQPSIEVILHLVAADVNTAEHTTKRQHTFLLRVPDTTLSGLSSTSEDLCYFFQASSEPEMAGWISALRLNSGATTNELEMKQPQEKSETLSSLAIVFVNVPEGLDDEEDETSGSIVPTEEGGRKRKGSSPSSSYPFSTSPSSASPLSSIPSSVDSVAPVPLSPATVRFLEGTGGVGAKEEEEEEADEAIVIPSISTRERSVSSLRLGNIISSASNRTALVDPSPLASSSIPAVNSPSEGIVPRNFTTSFLPSSSSSVASSPTPSSLSSPSLSSEKKAEFFSMLDYIDKEQERKEKRSSTARIKRRLSSGKRGALTGKTTLESINSPRKTPPQPPLPSSVSRKRTRRFSLQLLEAYTSFSLNAGIQYFLCHLLSRLHFFYSRFFVPE